jgi:hypothetical protein
MARRLARLAAAPAALALVSGLAPGLAAAAPTAIPAHVYSPYFEAWTTDTLDGISTASGAHYLTIAFLETPRRPRARSPGTGPAPTTSRRPEIPSRTSRTSAATAATSSSSGGWSADQGRTEIGDSCKNVDSIVAAYHS